MLLGCLSHSIERPELLRQRARRGGADVADADPEQQAVEGSLFRTLDCIHEVDRRLLCHAVERGEVLLFHLVEIADVAHKLPLHKLIDDRVAEPIDVQRTPRSVV